MMTPEGKVKKQIKALLDTIPKCWYFMPVSNGMGQHGIPDIIACIDGRLVGIETKAPGKIDNVTPLQIVQITRIELAGGIAFVTDSIEHCTVYLKMHGLMK